MSGRETEQSLNFLIKKVVVMDTGRSGREAAAFLKYLGMKSIDALVLSHADSDHAGGTDYLTARFKVKEMWDSAALFIRRETARV